jgi:hypothetical protein
MIMKLFCCNQRVTCMTTMTTSSATTALRIVLGVLGVLTVYVGIDSAFGGIATLGMQGPTNFFEIADQNTFRIRDSHTRFLGGVWLAAGLLLIGGAVRLAAFREAVFAVCAMAFVGGMVRFAYGGFSLFSDTGLGVALFIELVVFPVVALAAWKSGKPKVI